jgi:hypothetical protein
MLIIIPARWLPWLGALFLVALTGAAFLRAAQIVYDLMDPAQPTITITSRDITLFGVVGVFVMIAVGVWYFFRRSKPHEPLQEFMDDPWVRAHADRLGTKFFEDPTEACAAPNTGPVAGAETGITAEAPVQEVTSSKASS